MALVRNIVDRGGPNPDKQYPGDILSGNDNILGGQLTTVGNGTWLGAAMANGIIYRTGPTGAYTDTTDTAANIIAALKGGNYDVEAVPGSTFRLTLVNTVAFALTLAAGTGVTLGTGTTTIAASLWREYIVTILNSQPVTVLQAATTNGSAAVTFVFPGTQVAYGIGPNQKSLPLYEGCLVTGTGIPAGTTVTGLTMSGSGITGATLSANATATNSSVALTFGPLIQIDGLRSGTI